jgi:hypothetical protein
MRGAIAILALAAALLCAQGVSTRSVRPAPRGKPSGLPFHAKFTNAAKAAGLHGVTYYGSAVKKTYILESVGCGAAWVDYDGDGWLDAFVLSGTTFDEKPPADATNRLYRNNRDGTFTDVTRRAGLERTGWAASVAAADYDGDGDTDLFVTYYGDNALYRNNGDGTFTDVARESGLVTRERHWGSGATFIDYDRDGDLDLFVASYLEFDPARIPKPGQSANCTWKGLPVNCGPRGLPPGRAWLYRNDGGKFTDVTKEAGLLGAKGSYLMTAVAADFDNDGWPDLYVAADSTSSFFFRNNGNGTFSEQGLERGIAVNEDGMEQAGMGLGIGDYNLDGALDILKTHFSDDTNVLYRNDGKANFDDVTISSGLGVETRFVGWGAAIADFDNDGLPDLFWVTGSVYPEIEARLPAYPFRTPPVLFRNLGTRFEELFEQAGPAFAEAHSSRGAAFGDFDNDGDLDVLVVNLHEPPSLLRNDLPASNWLKAWTSAPGTRVTVTYGGRKQAQEMLSQSSYYSVNDPRLHFGLGAATEATVEVRWPDGKRKTFEKVKANQILDVRKPGE